MLPFIHSYLRHRKKIALTSTIVIKQLALKAWQRCHNNRILVRGPATSRETKIPKANFLALYIHRYLVNDQRDTQFFFLCIYFYL